MPLIRPEAKLSDEGIRDWVEVRGCVYTFVQTPFVLLIEQLKDNKFVPSINTSSGHPVITSQFTYTTFNAAEAAFGDLFNELAEVLERARNNYHNYYKAP